MWYQVVALLNAYHLQLRQKVFTFAEVCLTWHLYSIVNAKLVISNTYKMKTTAIF